MPTGNEVASSNPFSTGGGGLSFELNVQASLLATLLVRGIVPCLTLCQMRRLHLQGGHLGLRTDDAICVAVDQYGRELRLVCQIKHRARAVASDQEFSKAVSSMWIDHRASLAEPRQRDVFALVTGPTTVAMLTGLRTVLEWARNAADAGEFFRKLSIPKYASEDSRQQTELVRGVCASVDGTQVDDTGLWLFLRRFYFLTYDFDTAGSQDLARVKTMLALAARPSGPGTGEAIWNKLFHFLSLSNSRAATLTREDLPDEIKAACGSLDFGNSESSFERLRTHSRGVLKRIRMSIQGMPPLPRDEPRHRLAQVVEKNQFVVVSGPAGASKSALARMVFEKVFADSPLFAFQATEFARAHLDQVLLELRTDIGIAGLSALFSLHPHKCLLIDGLERLLEAEPRDAFFMFLEEVRNDPTWRVVFTCRQYSVDVAEAAFFRPLEIVPAVVSVPLFDDEELAAVARELPKLGPVLEDLRLRRLLRTPYYLDKAALVNWDRIDRSLPFGERGLRELIWRQVVIREDVTGDGMPLKRDRAFRAVCHRRARTMRSFVHHEDVPADAIQALLDDELLILDPRSNGVAPAHDVLEDWALIREVQQRYEEAGGQPRPFFESLGHQLTMRRCYRHWLQEALGGESYEEAFQFADAVTMDVSLEPYWRDDTLVSLMLSEHAEDYILAKQVALFDDGKKLLKRLIHLLRVACKQRHPSLPAMDGTTIATMQSWQLMPIGSGWSGVLRLVGNHLPSFTHADLPWLLRFLEDAHRGVANDSLRTEAVRALGLIAFHLWSMDGTVHFGDRELQSLAGILFSTCHACRPELTALMQRIASHRDWSHDEQAFAERLLTSADGMPACSSMPIEVAAFARRAWHLDRPPAPRPDHSASVGRGSWYGLGESHELKLFPPSALHGPFYFLLLADSLVGRKLIVDLVNTAYERYTRRWQEERPGLQPHRIELTVDDDGPVSQMASSIIWRAYREAGLAPDVVASALMSLEKWLLDLAARGSDLREICRALIRESNNVAVTAVIASVAIAHPASVGELIFALFRVLEFFSWDQERVVASQFSVDSIFGTLPPLPAHVFYEIERKRSDQMPHRALHLENLMLQLQFTSLRPEIEVIIDAHRAELPAAENQTEAQRIWRLLLHRADLRQHVATPEPESERTRYELRPPETDLNRMVQDHAPVAAAHHERQSVLQWAINCFNAQNGNYDPEQWRQHLARARALPTETSPTTDKFALQLTEGARVYVAAVCIRDHSLKLSNDERAWCRQVLLEAVGEREDDDDDEQPYQPRSPFHGSLPAAMVLPLLLEEGAEAANELVRLAIADAVTRTFEKVGQFAAVGIQRFLWDREPRTAWACAAGLVRWSAIRRECIEAEERRPWEERGNPEKKARERLPEIRKAIAFREGIEPQEVLGLDLSHWCGRSVLASTLTIVGSDIDSELARQFYRHVADGLVQVWKASRRGQSRDFEAELAARQHLAAFALVQPLPVALEIFQPLIQAVGTCAGEIAQTVESLVLAEDRIHSGENFWGIWQSLADALLRVDGLEGWLRMSHGDLAQLTAALFLRRLAQEEQLKDWRPLHGHEHRLRSLFERVGHCPAAFAAYAELISTAGSARLLPSAIKELSARLAAGAPRRILAEQGVLENLELVFSKWVYGMFSARRVSPDLVSAAVHVLGEMIEQGSSAAFHMREFVITPVGSFD